MAEDDKGSSMVAADHQGKKKADDDQKVPFYKLFSFADRTDLALITAGTIGAIANGLTQPFMTIIFGQLIDSFGSTDQSHVIHKISKVIKQNISFFFP